MAVTILDFAVLSIQILYFICLWLALRKGDLSTSPVQLPVSVIVCAHDEEENLRELIPLLLTQDYPQFEVIVVEDRCNDGTYDYLLQATKDYERLRMVRVTHKPEHITGKKFALTLGLKAARHDWVLLTDADCRPASSTWIAHMNESFKEPTKIVLGFSPYDKNPGLLNAFIRFESFLTGIQFIGMALLGRPYMGVGRNLAYRKELFFKAKGFNSHLGVTGGDDDLFVNEHATPENTAVRIGPASLVISKPKVTWRDFLHQKFRHLSVGRWYKFSDKVLLGVFSFSWILTWLVVLPGLFFLPLAKVLLAFFVIRMALLMTVIHFGSKKLGDSFEVWKTPLLDFMYAFYYLVTGAKALFVKKVKWKI